MFSPSAGPDPARRLVLPWLPEVVLLLIYVGTRVYHLAALPPHIDEVFHVYRAWDVWGGDPLYFINTTKLLNVWLIAAFYPFAAPYWVARMVSVLSGLVTLACVYKLARMLHSRAAGLLGVCLYVALPLTFWHDRIAISDPVAAATGALVTLGGAMLARRADWRYAVLVGLSLAAALLSKLTMLLVWPVPALAWVLLRRDWHAALLRQKGPAPLIGQGLVRLGGAYGVGLALVAPVIVYSYLFSDLGARQVANRTQLDASMPVRFADNAVQLFGNVRAYVGILILLWLVTALVVALVWHKRNRTLFLLGAAALPIGVLMAVGTRNDTRYYLVGVPPLLAVMGIGGALGWARLRRAFPDRVSEFAGALAGAGLVAALAVAYWPFFRGAYVDVPHLALPRSDYATYVSSYSSGFAWDAASDALRRMAAGGDRTVEVVAPVEGHAWRLQVDLLDAPGVEVFQPEGLTADWLAGRLAGGMEVYFVREEPRPAIDWVALGVRSELVESFAKPGGDNRVELRRLAPAGSETGP